MIVIDELDYLVTEDETILCNLFEWTSNPNSKIVLVGIANTMNLESILKHKTNSRMGENFIKFQSYDRDQILKIVINRLNNN